MQYAEALSWLYARQRFGIKQDLENMQVLLEALGHPEASFPAFHVTGTNGKGSVCAFLDDALRAGGYRTGRYVSPHLTSFVERITVAGRSIPRTDVAKLVEDLRPVVDSLDQRGVRPTFFEATTALAFEHFRHQKVDAGVIEVGMGGRWDATNVVTPVATVITNVGLDHTDRLGSTVSAIAKEKAGILRPRVPVLTRAVGDAFDVIHRRAREIEAPLRFVPMPNVEERLDGTRVELEFGGTRMPVDLRLLGKHQAENAAVAVAALAAVHERFPVPPERALSALSRTEWPGRLEPAGKNPLVLLDGAHNPAACVALAGFLERVVRPRRVHALFGALRDKDVPGMLRALAPAVDRWVMTPPPNARALPISELVGVARREGLAAESEPELVEAIRLLHRDADAQDVLLITGSLFLAGAARAALLKTVTDPPLPYAILQ